MNFICPYCKKEFETYHKMACHVGFLHKDVDREQLLTDYYYNGERPKCKCGCGNYTNITYDRKDNFKIKFADYCKGHYARVHNNWGHNERAKINSANTRREQFKQGARQVWNKGTKWEETFTKEKIKELRKRYSDIERNNKIRDKLLGVPKSEEHAKKIRERMNSEESREFYRNVMKKRLNDGKFHISSKLELDFIDEFIKPLGINYETQYYLKDIHQYCDIYIPSKNLIIEVDGSFWHADKRLFPNGAKYSYQKKRVQLDEIKNNYCKEKGIKCLRFWELDILHDKNKILETIQKQISEE